ncbi:Hypothetical protein SMAX5B_008162 [Scophthalmus maximus]|uniref:Uncharacterized protein n=1 Tax=Scophthalmus maximus TaxID=52904 RepID=A0A2U9CTC9_SCOMX|nr:Hypothetical protein SMAX5B_008162 [Scophthalmus maximus]
MARVLHRRWATAMDQALTARDEDNEDSTTLWASPQTFRDSNGSLEDEVDEDGQL